MMLICPGSLVIRLAWVSMLLFILLSGYWEHPVYRLSHKAVDVSPKQLLDGFDVILSCDACPRSDHLKMMMILAAALLEACALERRRR